MVQFKGLKIGDRVCLVAGHSDHREVAACTVAGWPAVSVSVTVDKIYHKGSSVSLNEGDKILVSELTLYLFAEPCDVCKGAGRKGQEAQGYTCGRCDGVGLEP